jgi:hypothetical protein
MIKMLRSTWMAAAVGSVLYLGTTALLWRMPAPAETASPEAGHTNRFTGPSWDFPGGEVDQLVEELKQEREALAKQRQELGEFKLRLDTERAELNLATQRVYQVQMDFEKTILRIRQEEAGNLKRIAKTLSTMTPEAAGTLFRGFDDTTAVKVLACMKEEESAPLLENMARKGEAEARRAGQLLEKMRLALASESSVKSK